MTTYLPENYGRNTHAPRCRPALLLARGRKYLRIPRTRATGVAEDGGDRQGMLISVKPVCVGFGLGRYAAGHKFLTSWLVL